jgi:hypothetical protein
MTTEEAIREILNQPAVKARYKIRAIELILADAVPAATIIQFMHDMDSDRCAIRYAKHFSLPKTCAEFDELYRTVIDNEEAVTPE